MPHLWLAVGVDRDSTSVIGDQQALAEVKQDQSVAPRILDDGTPADRDVERRAHNAPTSPTHSCRCFISGCHGEIGFQLWSLGLDHQLRIRLWHAQASRGVRPPDQTVAKLIAVERQTSFEIGHGYLQTVDLLEHRKLHGQGYAVAARVCGGDVAAALAIDLDQLDCAHDHVERFADDDVVPASGQIPGNRRTEA